VREKEGERVIVREEGGKQRDRAEGERRRKEIVERKNSGGKRKYKRWGRVSVM
jgi:hypothetical protein